jgi:hypothetical protein
MADFLAVWLDSGFYAVGADGACLQIISRAWRVAWRGFCWVRGLAGWVGSAVQEHHS